MELDAIDLIATVLFYILQSFGIVMLITLSFFYGVMVFKRFRH
jgi:hypothetical protein